jgi:hypothetical protein
VEGSPLTRVGAVVEEWIDTLVGELGIGIHRGVFASVISSGPGLEAGILDLTNPAGRSWFREVMLDQVTGVYSPKSVINPEILALQTWSSMTSLNQDRPAGSIHSSTTAPTLVSGLPSTSGSERTCLHSPTPSCKSRDIGTPDLVQHDLPEPGSTSRVGEIQNTSFKAYINPFLTNVSTKPTGYHTNLYDEASRARYVIQKPGSTSRVGEIQNTSFKAGPTRDNGGAIGSGVLDAHFTRPGRSSSSLCGISTMSVLWRISTHS